MLRSLIVLGALFTCTLPAAMQAQESRVVNGYFVEWGLYATPTPFFVKNLVLNGDAERLTQITYAFGVVANGKCGLTDPWADVQRPFTANESVSGEADASAPTALHGNFNQLLQLKQRYPQLKIVMALGGGGVAAPFAAAAATAQSRRAFVSSCISTFIGGNFGNGVQVTPGIFDGIDIDWEYPLATDTANLVELVKEFRTQLDQVRPGMVLTMAAPAGHWAYQNINLPETVKYLSFFDLMAYDYAGPWQNVAGFVAPLYQTSYDPDPTNNVDASVTGYLQAGVPPEKLVMGIPFYGYGWTVTSVARDEQFMPGTAVDQGDSYAYIASLMPTFREYRSEPGKTPFLANGKQFWTYDDPESIREKLQYARDHRLRGAMVWELSQDLPDGLLLHTVADAVKNDQ